MSQGGGLQRGQQGRRMSGPGGDGLSGHHAHVVSLSLCVDSLWNISQLHEVVGADAPIVSLT